MVVATPLPVNRNPFGTPLPVNRNPFETVKPVTGNRFYKQKVKTDPPLMVRKQCVVQHCNRTLRSSFLRNWQREVVVARYRALYRFFEIFRQRVAEFSFRYRKDATKIRVANLACEFADLVL